MPGNGTLPRLVGGVPGEAGGGARPSGAHVRPVDDGLWLAGCSAVSGAPDETIGAHLEGPDRQVGVPDPVLQQVQLV